MATYPANLVPSFDYEQSVGFDVAVTRYVNGTEQRISRLTQSAQKFRLVYNYLSPTDMDTLYNFFIARGGKKESFNYTCFFTGIAYVVRFDMDEMSKILFSHRAQRSGISLIQVFGETPDA